MAVVPLDADVVAGAEAGFGTAYRVGICIGRGNGKVTLLTYAREVIVVREEDVLVVRPFLGRPVHRTLAGVTSATWDADEPRLVASMD